MSGFSTSSKADLCKLCTCSIGGHVVNEKNKNYVQNMHDKDNDTPFLHVSDGESLHVCKICTYHPNKNNDR